MVFNALFFLFLIKTRMIARSGSQNCQKGEAWLDRNLLIWRRRNNGAEDDGRFNWLWAVVYVQVTVRAISWHCRQQLMNNGGGTRTSAAYVVWKKDAEHSRAYREAVALEAADARKSKYRKNNVEQNAAARTYLPNRRKIFTQHRTTA
jgi:hypothetical protein